MADLPLQNDDLACVAEANRGNPEAFGQLYQRYRGWVFALALRYCGNEHDAADVLQNTFLYFFKKFPGFELQCRVKTFLYPVVTHLALDQKKRSSRSQAAEDVSDDVPSPEYRNEAAERARLLDLVATLTEDQREVVILRFADGLELKEISDIMRIPVGTVKSRLHNALETLRAEMRKKTAFE